MTLQGTTVVVMMFLKAKQIAKTQKYKIKVQPKSPVT